MRIKPFDALRPTPESAPNVASVPYDTVNTEEARERAKDNPSSFLHVIRPEIDLPDGTEPHSDRVYEKARQALQNLVASGAMQREGRPCFYVYTQKMGDHEQTGVVACCHIDDYANNLILKHEKTRREKEDDRTRHVLTLRANTGPVFLTYKGTRSIDQLVAAKKQTAPIFQIEARDKVLHTVWRVDETDPLAEAFKHVEKTYVADGHHRSAAAARAGSTLRDRNPNHTGNEEYCWFLSVLFPASQLQILSYNRVVADLNGLSADAFLNKVADVFNIQPTESPTPDSLSSATLYVDGKWYRISWPPVDTGSPSDDLDVSVLQHQLLTPILGIGDPRTDNRINFVGGIRGTGQLEQLVESGAAAVAFVMHPVTVEQMMAIADADGIMPPKSTWFEPKLSSGLFVHTL